MAAVSEVTAARMDPVEGPDLQPSSHSNASAGRKGFSACEILTVLNLSRQH